MNLLNLDDIKQYVEENIEAYHLSVFKNLLNLKFDKLLKRKNPYLFKAKNILTAEQFVTTVLDAHLSSQEETIFGNFLEGLAIFICGKVYGGKKSAAQGIDLEFERDNAKFLVSIKSGPHWGNSTQISKMKDNFRKAKQILRQNNIMTNVMCINGCCYGKEANADKGDYLKLCGQEFWEFISGNSSLYLEIIDPLGNKARERNDKFKEEYAKIINKFSAGFYNDYCIDGKIDWEKIVKLNSAKELKQKKEKKK